MSRWIEALPCISFTVAERKIARKHGFLSYPEFLDNFYISEENRANFPKFHKHLCRNKNLVIFAVYPDNRKDLTFYPKNYGFAEWIYPLHTKEQLDFVLKHDFEWVGFPHDQTRRAYSLSWYLNRCDEQGLKKWYLGFWLESNPYVLHDFDALDSTLPETYSGKYGKLWYSWMQHEQPRTLMPTKELLEHNVRAFRNALDKLSFTTHKKLIEISVGE